MALPLYLHLTLSLDVGHPGKGVTWVRWQPAAEADADKGANSGSQSADPLPEAGKVLLGRGSGCKHPAGQ